MILSCYIRFIVQLSYLQKIGNIEVENVAAFISNLNKHHSLFCTHKHPFFYLSKIYQKVFYVLFFSERGFYLTWGCLYFGFNYLTTHIFNRKHVHSTHFFGKFEQELLQLEQFLFFLSYTLILSYYSDCQLVIAARLLRGLTCKLLIPNLKLMKYKKTYCCYWLLCTVFPYVYSVLLYQCFILPLIVALLIHVIILVCPIAVSLNHCLSY